MTAESTPRPPVGLSRRGRAFWRAITDAYDLSAGEVQLLTEAARVLDELEALHKVIRGDGIQVAGSMGQKRVHPALAESRATRDLFAKLLKALDLEDPDEQADPASIERARLAREAARARWDQQGRRARERSGRRGATA